MLTLLNLWIELKRMWPLLLVVLLAVLILGDAAQLAVQLVQLSMVALVVILIHVGRKALFPYLDLRKFVVKALESPIGAALLAFGLFLFMAAFLVVGVVKS